MGGFTVREFHDLIKILEEHPEWREELRRLVLTDEILRLPDVVRELTEAQRRTEEELKELAARVNELTARVDDLTVRVNELTARVDELTARVNELTARVDELTVRVNELAEAQRKTEEELRKLAARVDELAEAQAKTEEELRKLVARVDALSRDVAELKGDSLERRYRERAFAYFGQLIRRAHTLSPDEIVELIEDGVDRGLLTEEERDELAWTDVIVRGKERKSGEEVYLAVEVWGGVGVEDVERAARRADMLR
ncbi:hypothetical protein DRP77_07475, partial [Candidatus Poribacteria bacterium]